MPLLVPSVLLAALPVAAGDFDDGRYINRLDVQGAADLGGEWRSNPDFAETGFTEPAVNLRLAPRGAFFWQTRDLDLAVEGALFPRWSFEPGSDRNHRPDGLGSLDLDVRPARRLGLRLDIRVLADSPQLSVGDRPEPWHPHGVPLWSADLGEEILWTDADMGALLELHLPDELYLGLGGAAELDRPAYQGEGSLPFTSPLRWTQRLGGGPVAEAGWFAANELQLFLRGQLHFFAWAQLQAEEFPGSLDSGTEWPSESGQEWQVYGGLQGALSPQVRLRALGGYCAQWDGFENPGPLLVGELGLGPRALRELRFGYRRGARDLHVGFEHAYHYAFLRYQERALARADLALELGLRSSTPLDEQAELGLRGALEANFWPASWWGLGLGTWLESGPVFETLTDLRWANLGVLAQLRFGRVQRPSWMAPQD